MKNKLPLHWKVNMLPNTWLLAIVILWIFQINFSLAKNKGIHLSFGIGILNLELNLDIRFWRDLLP